MPTNTTQVIFECPAAFKRRIEQEKLKRAMSVKKMIVNALEDYWRRPAKPHYRRLRITPKLTGTEDQIHWADMFMEYLERCPPAKVELLQRVIEEDLKVHRTTKKKESPLEIRLETAQAGSYRRLPKR